MNAQISPPPCSSSSSARCNESSRVNNILYGVCLTRVFWSVAHFVTNGNIVAWFKLTTTFVVMVQMVTTWLRFGNDHYRAISTTDTHTHVAHIYSFYHSKWCVCVCVCVCVDIQSSCVIIFKHTCDRSNIEAFEIVCIVTLSSRCWWIDEAVLTGQVIGSSALFQAHSVLNLAHYVVIIDKRWEFHVG